MSNGEGVAIFWDYENCPAPSNGSGYVIAKNISTLAQQFGTVKSFKAYLEISEQVPRALVMRSELQSSGVSLIDCPHNGRKDVADKMILVDMLTHAIDTPPPSTVVLITGDRDFAYAVSILRLRRYRVVLLTLTNAHPSLTMQASVCYDWMSEVVDVSDSPKCQSGIKAGQNLNSPRKEEGFRETISASPLLKTRGMPQEELEGFTNEEPVDNTSYLAGRTHHRRLSQPFTVSGPNPRQTPSERLREDTANAVSSKLLQMPPATMRIPTANLPFPSTLCTLMQNECRGPSAAQSPATVATVVNPSSPWTTSLDIFDPEESTAKRIRTPVPKETLSVLTDTDMALIEDVLPVGPGVISPSPRPASAPCLLPSPPVRPFQSQPPSPLAPTPTAPPSVQPPSVQPPSTQAPPPPPTPLNAPITSSIPSHAASQPIPSTNPPKVITSATLPRITENVLPVPPPFAILVDTLQDHRLKGNLRPLRSTVGMQISKGGATYKNAGVGKFSQYIALAQERGIVELGGMEAAAWISLCPGWGKANLS